MDTYLRALDRAVCSAGEQVFLRYGDRDYSYSKVDQLSNALARSLTSVGVAAGNTVVGILDNSIDAVLCWFAVNKIGAIWVPINTAYRHEFLRHQIADSGAAVVICEASYLDRVTELLDRLPGVRTVLSRGDDRFDCGPVRVAPLDEHRGDDSSPLEFSAAPRDLACLIYTSGTTGPSKGCMISHNYLCNHAIHQNLCVPPKPREITWTCLPLFHIGAASCVIVSTILAQATAAISGRFSVSSFWSEIEASGATTAMLMASMFPLLAQAPDDPAMQRCRGRLRAVTGVPITSAVRKIWTERFGVPYLNSYGYGQTEASKISMLKYGEQLPPDDSAGRVSDDFELRIVDDEGEPVGPNVQGEILIRPRKPGVMFDGYWRRPDKTVEVWRDLWMHTGDIGRLDEAGNLYFVDRKKDYLRSRGENISSFEVETAFMQHPYVREIAVHAVKSAAGGEDDIKATVVLRDDAVLTERELCEWAIKHLPHFAVPQLFEFRVDLPKTGTGRIQKFQLRDDGRTSSTWDAREAGIIVRRRSVEPELAEK